MLPNDIDLSPYIDYAILDPAASDEQIDYACEQADRFGFASLCVYPCNVKRAKERLLKTKVEICTVIGFPSGATTSNVKLYEAMEAVENGATELDVVINLGWLKTGQTNLLHQDVAQICEESGKPVKAILELSLLTPVEQELAAEISMDAGVAFLKTGTGWAGGATVEMVKFLKGMSRGKVGVKASGGIRTREQAIALLNAGATRLGTSHGVAIARA
ncbi:MAG: deoxyribose-phosphate aldolase [Pseudanabaena sp.]|jgi:deoxyribose-phosphate aldolase|uniref:deoxyribose-phosphate aldolase n=1 Tax=Pseudanabaena mucicola TaxID=71190 RepID=UPI00257896F2|nr:deoxyribose-phosphate aldolase [Pseudanabaena mucicola]MCA6508015.1 deoxyribose-phosphate aldolase [Pseudanabaena sp. M172S2SP2A07QC]MCA6574516.1 deoxyribose-phosphate aldolase [Pseudanabaena sp. M53BS1SP1A06MG]MCA6581633.1 deoxyribose-phosphate aldolase [Pseudanabaena sp. M34BS1SP1A06MG]MCA6586524.1 deoxyribose-phosphate aldolase [Pseudanabaena sp. M051S1SP1A06QC]MCA6588850.1 deoxyribose-phosphate aldolase [Pseudanabaena sp. M109S1SP1A06QC]MCA6593407.1 deoxyribose-phosphate aldolase [Pseu